MGMGHVVIVIGKHKQGRSNIESTSEHVAKDIDRNVRPDEREVVHGCMNFLWSRQAQEAFRGYYFRPVIPLEITVSSHELLVTADLFTVDDLGGWGHTYPDIIHGLVVAGCRVHNMRDIDNSQLPHCPKRLRESRRLEVQDQLHRPHECTCTGIVCLEQSPLRCGCRRIQLAVITPLLLD